MRAGRPGKGSSSHRSTATVAMAHTNREKKQQLLVLIAQKENEQLAGTSLDELRKMAESM